MEKVLEIDIENYPDFLSQLVAFADKFTNASVLTSNQYPDKYGKYELLAGIGNHKRSDSFEGLQEQINEKRWLFGHLGYDLKNELEELTSCRAAKFKFDPITFFEPQILLKQLKDSSIVSIFIQKEINEEVLGELFKLRDKVAKVKLPPFQSRLSRLSYIKALDRIQEEIQYGNVYEINYCQEFYAEKTQIDPKETFVQLNKKSPMPFAAFYKNNSEYLLCASPERYLKKEGEQLISQPIKGTGRRGETEEENLILKAVLRADLKEQTENVMIVDLVRNDLSRTAQKGSVQVKELLGVYQFPQVNQLISTIESQLSPNYSIIDVIKTTFPMGSMTGAPKISAMQIADRLEGSRRELYSGAVGYIDPEGNFDFNVVIRSLLYSKKTKYLSLTVGGAITAMSDSEREYEECLLKAKAIFEL